MAEIFNQSYGDIERVLMVGPIGSGKSYASSLVASELDLPLITLDRLMLDENQHPLPKAAFIDKATEYIHQPQFGDGWVIDGTYRSLRALTWEQADAIGYIRPRLTRNVAQVAMRALRKDTSGGNSSQSIGKQLARLRTTRTEDIHKIDETTDEFIQKGTLVVRGYTSMDVATAIIAVARPNR